MIKIIAEAGINHNGVWSKALDLVEAAHKAGADAVKFQYYHTDLLVRDVPNRELLKRCELSLKAHRAVKAYCDELGIEWMVSCFDLKAVDQAVALGALSIKVGSGEIVNLKLIEHIGRHKKPIILSTGMSTEDDIIHAIHAYRDTGSEDLTLLHCVSNYPTETDHLNMRVVETLRDFFNCSVGFSDHCLDGMASYLAVACGVSMIEKHIMLDRFECPDSNVSLRPVSFMNYVDTIRRAEHAMGDGVKRLQPGEEEMQKLCRYRWHAIDS